MQGMIFVYFHEKQAQSERVFHDIFSRRERLIWLDLESRVRGYSSKLEIGCDIIKGYLIVNIATSPYFKKTCFAKENRQKHR